MKHPLIRLIAILALCSGLFARGSTLYVDLNNSNPTPPFSDWSTAATNIQDAIDASVDGDQVWVTNGVYQTGGRVMAGNLTNRVVLDKAVTVQSVNGPLVTTIAGIGATNNTIAVRCAWLTNNASLIGFTLVRGATRTSGDSTTLESGGGVWCASLSSTVASCIIVSNTALRAGAAFQGTLNACYVSSNSLAGNPAGGAAYGAVLNNCTVVSNSCVGLASCFATNSIIYYDPAGEYTASSLSYCCTTPLAAGTGNFTNAPQFFADRIHLLAGSACEGAGTTPVANADIAGRAWGTPPAVGCAEAAGLPLVSQPRVQFASAPLGFSIGNVSLSGIGPFAFGWLKDGAPLQDDGHFTFTQTTNLRAVGVTFADVGNYQIVVGNTFGMVTSAVAQVTIHCVDAASMNPMAPYTNWETAATNIQDAIDASADGNLIWVTNGIYQTGGKVMAGDLTNRVALNKPVTVLSVNGPLVTTIAGIGATNGAIAVRCAWLTNNAALVGFTLTRGATRSSGDLGTLEAGGGVWCASSNASVSGCMIVSNAAYFRGGGAFQGNLSACFISSNSVTTPLGGAAASALLNNCTIMGNPTPGLVSCQATNSIIYYNLAPNYTGGSFSYCCVIPAAGGTGNFTGAPLFFPDHMHLITGSPGIGAGTTAVTDTDIFGREWGSPPTVGCVEATGLPVVSQPQIQLTSTPIGFTVSNVFLSGTGPFTFNWLKDGLPLQDNGHFVFTQNTNLEVVGVNLADAGNYQLMVSNTMGAITSAVMRVVIHTVDVSSLNPIAPYSSWETAATNIQDAIDAAVDGEFVLVTNGVYSSGGKVMVTDLTNRVALDKALTVISVNGYANTVIEGASDPTSTNGPAAVRCAWLTNGATLNGFTLRKGATRTDTSTVLGYGGGAWLSTNAVISNCVLTNNNAYFAGGGMAFGTANNCFLTYNTAQKGGGAYQATLNNCTVRENHGTPFFGDGAGTYSCFNRNCIVYDNYLPNSGFADFQLANYGSLPQDTFTNCCTIPLPPRGSNNITTSPLFLNYNGGFTLSPASPCRGAGNPRWATGNDLDGEPFLNPPAIGCDEVITTNLAGPLAFTFLYFGTNTIANHRIFFASQFEGRPSELDWSFGDGPTVTNLGGYVTHMWTNAGTYVVTLTAYNVDHPLGVSSNLVVVIDPFLAPSLQSAGVVSNAFQFSFAAQENAIYSVQFATNLTPPIAWQILQIFLFSPTNTVMTVQDPAVTNGTRFYRVTAQ